VPLKKKLDTCFKEGARGGERHKGLRRVSTAVPEVADKFLQKAKHNLDAVTDFKNMGYSDWSASASFYALYHCLLALLAKHGYESRNQSCTFAFIENLIEKKECLLALEDLQEIFDKDVTEDIAHSNKILDIRETMQYSFKTSLEQKEFDRLLERTNTLFKAIRKEIER
jgi:uncharacterized protein (UPF0332 family)